MARTDDYVNAFRIAAAELQTRDPLETSQWSGADYDRTGQCFRLDFIGRGHVVTIPDVEVKLVDSEEEVPLTEKVLILHYLNRAIGVPEKGEWITYREVPSGEFYYSAFYKRAEAPLISAFGSHPAGLIRLAPRIGGEPISGQGDAAACFRALPRVPISLVIWGGDDEFEPSGKILFDRSIPNYLPTEDIAWISGMIVYRLMKLARDMNGGR